ncbi:MAG: hypothetical protein WD602_02360 [Actinomycetota bacterium]
MQLKTCAASDPVPEAFFQLPRELAVEDPHALPPDPAAETSALRAVNARLTWIEDNGIPLARCATGLRPDPHTAWIGHFAARNHPEAVTQLFSAVEGDLQSQGVRRIFGPLNADTWHDYRLNLNPAAAPPFLREPWNPPYYPKLWEQNAYPICDRYHTARIRDLPAALERLSPFLRRLKRQGCTLTPLNPRAFPAELDRLHALSLNIFNDNPHYTPIDADAFHALYARTRSLLLPDLCLFCRDPRGNDVGFVFAYPDDIAAVRAMRGQRTLPARLRFLVNRRRDRLCIKSLGCTPETRGTGVGPALMAAVLQVAIRRRFPEALMCLMHDDNDSRRLDGGTSEPFREYALYAKDLTP